MTEDAWFGVTPEPIAKYVTDWPSAPALVDEAEICAVKLQHT